MMIMEGNYKVSWIVYRININVEYFFLRLIDFVM